jgi:HSP20 family protein
VIRREIRHGEFARSFRLPAHITPENVSANYRNGLLEVRIAGVRQPEPEPARIPVTTTVQGDIDNG